jgi:predicted RNA-binding Zn-ribbon protein involved in translation (DUF1610 family)
MNALAIAGQLEQEVNPIEHSTIEALNFECPNIECGAVFSYRRVSCGHFAQPEFCPTCGEPMADTQEDGLTIVLVAEELPLENLPDWRQLRDQV